MKDSVFEVYEPHTEYLRAVMLRPDNFNVVADELSRWDDGKYYVGKVISYGDPYALTLTPRNENSSDETMTCHLYQMFVQRKGKPLEVVDRYEIRHEWRLVAADPYRTEYS
jgi:hypothetical protein